MRTGQGHFVLITALTAVLLISKIDCGLPPVGSFCSTDHFCDGDEDHVAKIVKKENLHKNTGGTKKIESENKDEFLEEIVRQQYEDFPSPEVTLKQLEDEKLR